MRAHQRPREADLRIGLKASAVKAASWSVRILILVATILLLGLFGWWARSFRSAI
jgi:hypothetical protein